MTQPPSFYEQDTNSKTANTNRILTGIVGKQPYLLTVVLNLDNLIVAALVFIIMMQLGYCFYNSY
jgi:hypothetical protein